MVVSTIALGGTAANAVVTKSRYTVLLRPAGLPGMGSDADGKDRPDANGDQAAPWTAQPLQQIGQAQPAAIATSRSDSMQNRPRTPNSSALVVARLEREQNVRPYKQVTKRSTKVALRAWRLLTPRYRPATARTGPNQRRRGNARPHMCQRVGRNVPQPRRFLRIGWPMLKVP